MRHGAMPTCPELVICELEPTRPFIPGLGLCPLYSWVQNPVVERGRKSRMENTPRGLG